MDGKKILGQYPRDLDDSGSDVFQPGIAIPTTPWDAVWNGISRWLGINNSADLDEVIPNRGTFMNLFGKEELFKTWPSQSPSEGPPSAPTRGPSGSPSSYRTTGPSGTPSLIPSSIPSPLPSQQPSFNPSLPSPNSTDDFKFSTSDCVRISFHFNSIILVLNLLVSFL